MNTYWFPLEDLTGNLPVWSEYDFSNKVKGTIIVNTLLVLLFSGSWRGGGSGLGWVLVEFIPCLCIFVCPMEVAMDLGRCFCISSTVSPGHPMKCPYFMAEMNVEGTGEKLHAW